MSYCESFDDLNRWQKAMVRTEALAICRSNDGYVMLEQIANGDNESAAVAADDVMYHMRNDALIEVLSDPCFMEGIMNDEETINMTKGNNHARSG